LGIILENRVLDFLHWKKQFSKEARTRLTE
jgi:hypothetical protein